MRRKKGSILGKSERRGMLAVGLTLLVIWTIRWIPQPDSGLTPQNEPTSVTDQHFSWKENKNWNDKRPKQPRYFSGTLRPFPFNPNTVSADSLLKLGLPNSIVQKWLKARERGFVFRKEGDVLKFSILPEAVRTQLLPYMVLPQFCEQIRQKWQPPPRPKIMVELNRADTLELQGLPGIGPALAQRVVKYRDRLGGFHRTDQLLEVYGVDSALLNQILPQIQIDPQRIQTRSWNTISLEELKLIPYLTNKEAQIIVQYRKVHGAFATMESVKKIKGIRSDIPEKLTPYLHFEL